MTMEVCGASLSCGVRRAAWTNVRRVCNYRVDVRVAIGARLVVSIRSYLSHITDKGLKNEHYRCDPVAARRLGQGWARNAPTYTHVAVSADGSTVVSGDSRTVIVWEAASGERRREMTLLKITVQPRPTKTVS